MQLRQQFLPRSVEARSLRGLLRGVARTAARAVFGRAALDDPLDGRFLPYYGLGKRRLTLLLDATNKCNLRCVMCHFALPATRRERVVQWSPDDLERLEREVLPFVSHTWLSAGTEPLMWRGFPRLLEAVRRAGVPSVELITNGLLLTDELAERIVRADVTRVQLSLDGATAQTYESIRAGGRFADFLAAVERLNAAKRRAGSRLPELQFNFTLMRRNVDELEELVRLARDHGVRYLDVRHLVLYPGLDLERETLLTDRARSNRALGRARALAAELGLELARWPEDFALEAGGRAVDVPEPAATDVVPIEREAPVAESAPMPVTAPAPAPAVGLGASLEREAGPRTGAPPLDGPCEPAVESEPRELDEPSARASPPAPNAVALALGDLPQEPLCSAPWRQFHVRPDQSVVPCCFWYTGNSLGDLGRQSFESIWQGAAYRRLRREVLTGELEADCAHCPVTGIGSVQDDAAFRALEG